MKIIDFIKDIRERFLTIADKNRAIENLIKKSYELHICDLDLALTLFASIFYFGMEENRRLFGAKCELFKAVADSSYAKYFAPSLFANEIVTVDDEQREKDVLEAVAEAILKFKITKEGFNVILEHDLLNPINVSDLGINKTNLVNSTDEIQIQIIGNDIYSFGFSQTRLNLINDIIVTNISDKEIKNAKLVITTEPNYIEFSEINIALINPHQSIVVSEFNAKPHLEELLNLQEKTIGHLTASIYIGDTKLVDITHTIEYLSYDTWFENHTEGSSALFVTPNDIAVKNIVSLTGKELQKLTGDPSISGYQTEDKNLVVNHLKALYNALYNEGIAYINPPASFEDRIGQKVRMPHDVLMHKQGTCLDLAILFASCIENMGLNPVLILVRGHAFVGVFLEEIGFYSLVNKDPASVLEMSSEEENKIIFIECTAITAGQCTSFEEACFLGKQAVIKNITDSQFCAIDIYRARRSGFLPLPINYDDVERIKVDFEVAEQNKVRLARKSYSYKGDKIELSEAELNKFDVWEKKLLDLSKRNQLINYKITGKGLQLFYYDLNDLYNAFAEGSSKYSINTYVTIINSIFELQMLPEEEYNEIKQDFKQGRITSVHKSPNQINSLKSFYKDNKHSIEETGSNILYLALGFVRYFHSDKSMTPSYAPIILVPIDIQRHSTNNYSVFGRGETPFLNISIFEYFRQEFGMNFDDLLSLDLFNGETIDVDTILNTVSEKIQKLTRASVVRTAAINTFDFSKAVMWSDVKFRRKELSKNKIIKSLIEKKYIFDKTDDYIEEFDDDSSNPIDLAIPLPADSSQITAIKDCALGKSFILQGPPGTGKSQTITNMIVNAIYHGKTVLFVAEKMAALDVVRNRLNNLNLGQFALEAHSTKAGKSTLMSQFEERVALGRTITSSDEYLLTAEQIKKERLELNRVINLLHKENGYFLSFYDAFVNYLDIDDQVGTIDLGESYVATLNSFDFFESARLCQQLYNYIVMNGSYLNNPFLFYRDKNYIHGYSKRKLIGVVEEYLKQLSTIIDAVNSFNTANQINVLCKKDKVELLTHLLTDERIENDVLPNILEVDFTSIDTHIENIVCIGKKLEEQTREIRENFNDGIFGLDVEHLIDHCVLLTDSFFLKRIFGMNKVTKTVNIFSNAGKKVTSKDVMKYLVLVKETLALEKQLREQMKRLQIVFGSLNGVDIKTFGFEEFQNKYFNTKEVASLYGKQLGFDALKTIITKIQSFSVFKKNELLNAYNDISLTESTMEKESGFDFSYRDKFNLTYKETKAFVERIGGRIDYLQSWCSLLKTYEECKTHQLHRVIEYIENSKEVPHDLELVYKKSIYAYIMSKTILGDESGSFNSIELKNHAQHYKGLIDKFVELTIKETAARVSARMPSIRDTSPTSSQHGILNKAIKNKCRGKAIRQLFEEIPDILTKVFPVFLMSPMSCAQYLSPDMPKFDIVIFDEASQMPTSEAIGAIARGESLIVVGDSNQMPPTMFFKSKGSEDLDSDIDDLDSILEDCSSILMPTRGLNWHYRSKHESLITFSNAKFYDNRLITFPSPNDMINKVSFVNTKGVYGEKNRTNPIEAKAIIKEVERRLRNPALKDQSIGIVTFSSVQQEMIDDMLQEFFARHKDLEKIALEKKEPIIVKNLENMQGDERDVVLLSICYGPKKDGSMIYNFGPINNQGGEKRLNVAVSRARYEMVVFASFEPEKLALMRTDSRGAKELFNFMKYAKYGPEALILPNGSVIENKVGFEKHIAAKLEERGYKVRVGIGKSNFRVDVGIVNPDNENQYILGVLCDSYSYQSATTAKDRNIVQPSALKLLGWNLIRVWSFDYLDDPKKVVDDICDMVEDIRQHPEQYSYILKENTQLEIEFETEEVQTVDYSKEYTPYTDVYNLYYSSYDTSREKTQIIYEILKMEAPISKDVLQNRFAHAIGVTRAGSNIQNDMLKALKDLRAGKTSSYHDKNKHFFWLEGQTPEMSFYRVGGSKPRAMIDIPKEEIFVAIKETLINYGPVFRTELITYVAKAFDIKAVGKQVNIAINDAIDCYLDKGLLVTTDNSRIGLKNR